jgi:hypothetical protein
MYIIIFYIKSYVPNKTLTGFDITHDPSASISSVEGGDDTCRPRLQGTLVYNLSEYVSVVKIDCSTNVMRNVNFTRGTLTIGIPSYLNLAGVQ